MPTTNQPVGRVSSPGVFAYALSIRQPWAWLILNAGKDIENRDWRTGFRGPCLIHAAKTMTRADYNACCLFLADDRFDSIELPLPQDLQRGGIVGQATVDACLIKSDSKWFCGPYGFKLSNPRELPFTPLKGRLGFFPVPMPFPSPAPICRICQHWDTSPFTEDCAGNPILVPPMGSCPIVGHCTTPTGFCDSWQPLVPSVPSVPSVKSV
jgi:hypothetical protein